MCFKSQRQHLAQLRHAGISVFDPEPAGCLLEPEINFSCQSKEGWNTKRKTEHSAFRDLSIFIIWLQAEHKLVETRQARTQKVQYRSFYALFIYNSTLNRIHFFKTALFISHNPWKFQCIFQSSLLSAFPGNVWDLRSWYNGRIQRNDQAGRAAAGRTSPKTCFSSISFVVFPFEEHPCTVSRLNCFPLSGVRVMETIKRIPGSKRWRRPSSWGLTSRWTEEKLGYFVLLALQLRPLHFIIIPVQILVLELC